MKTKNERIWINVKEADDWLSSILGQKLYEMKIESVSLYSDIRSVKMIFDYTAEQIRKEYVFDPAKINPERFDLYRDKGIRLMVHIQYGEVISGYIEIIK